MPKRSSSAMRHGDLAELGLAGLRRRAAEEPRHLHGQRRAARDDVTAGEHKLPGRPHHRPPVDAVMGRESAGPHRRSACRESAGSTSAVVDRQPPSPVGDGEGPSSRSFRSSTTVEVGIAAGSGRGGSDASIWRRVWKPKPTTSTAAAQSHREAGDATGCRRPFRQPWSPPPPHAPDGGGRISRFASANRRWKSGRGLLQPPVIACTPQASRGLRPEKLSPQEGGERGRGAASRSTLFRSLPRRTDHFDRPGTAIGAEFRLVHVFDRRRRGLQTFPAIPPGSSTRATVCPAGRVSKYCSGRRKRCANNRCPSSTSIRLVVCATARRRAGIAAPS